MSPFIISVEGNIGSGKSTFVRLLQKTYFQDTKVIFLQEPVDSWSKIQDTQGETILSKFYADQKKYSFAFQMMAYISRLALLKETLEANPDAVIITERCLLTDKNVFAKMLYDSGLIEEVEYQIYLKWFYNFQNDFPISYTIYLDTDPTIAFERVKKRNREGEDIPLSYLQQCHDYHTKWLYDRELAPQKVFVLDANEDKNNDSVMNQWIQKVRDIISQNKKCE